MTTPGEIAQPASGPHDGARRWRALSFLYLGGALIGTVSLLLPNEYAHAWALWTNAGLAFVVSLCATLFARRLPLWANHVVLALGTLIITRSVYDSGDATSYYAIWYVWVPLYAFSFHSRGAAIAHTAFVGFAYAAVLWAMTPVAPVARWITTIATVVIAALFVDTLVRELRRHAAKADVSAIRLEGAAQAMQQFSRCDTRLAVYRALADAVAGVPGIRSAEIAAERPTVGQCDILVQVRGGVHGEVNAWLVVRLDSPLSTEVRHTIDMLVGEAGSSLTRIDLMARLEAAARTDDLTGLPNRRSWDEELARTIAHARRFGIEVCVGLLDLDGFKELNDDYGHRAGDEMLAAAAARWSGGVRDVDTLARWGGDEFAIIVPGCDLAAAGEAIERVRRLTPPGVTCSAGLVCWNGIEGEAELMARADDALYRAKRAGRDRLVVLDESANTTV